MNTDRLKDDNALSPPTAKKPYEAPVLKDWGTLADITLTNGNNGKADGGRPPFSKTR